MSDEYGRNGFKDSLVDDSINKSGINIDEQNDTTSSGGYNTTPEMWSDKAQRGNAFETKGHNEQPSNGLIDQSLNGSNLKNELQDAKQGKDSGNFVSTDI
ncbi:hypothetical protein BT96DRAFT_918142 [Gymnopus androsaceus JB14]|uniref:Uncharacterized protein n=1 Tax=Gymnopus androsaceus JB14 TaxID=1447944 RepID=A0A6A4HY20_9AGAR|nr:hypothetical protein BT96DRAFT_918142 [Gymnopus androsaceus JB14]